MSTHDSDQLLNYNSRSSILYVAENVIFQLCLCVLPLQLYLTLCDPMNYGPPGSSVHGILQARTLEWLAMPSSRGSSQLRNQTHVSCIGRWVLSVQLSAVAQSCPTLCDPMNRSMSGLPVHQQLPEFTQTQVHRVSDAIHPAISSSVFLFSSCPQSLPASESFPMSQLFT